MPTGPEYLVFAFTEETSCSSCAVEHSWEYSGLDWWARALVRESFDATVHVRRHLTAKMHSKRSSS
ncbi:hypothetical protein BDQ17DRAFT_1438164 [Cyathus striatus]|nr:hypothetical protein BDQ17DRAFT_1438164 [Cyathus striatus]